MPQLDEPLKLQWISHDPVNNAVNFNLFGKRGGAAAGVSGKFELSPQRAAASESGQDEIRVAAKALLQAAIDAL